MEVNRFGSPMNEVLPMAFLFSFLQDPMAFKVVIIVQPTHPYSGQLVQPLAIDYHHEIGPDAIWIWNHGNGGASYLGPPCQTHVNPGMHPIN